MESVFVTLSAGSRGLMSRRFGSVHILRLVDCLSDLVSFHVCSIDSAMIFGVKQRAKGFAVGRRGRRLVPGEEEPSSTGSCPARRLRRCAFAGAPSEHLDELAAPHERRE